MSIRLRHVMEVWTVVHHRARPARAAMVQTIIVVTGEGALLLISKATHGNLAAVTLGVPRHLDELGSSLVSNAHGNINLQKSHTIHV